MRDAHTEHEAGWTAARTEQLRTLWGQHSCSEIAAIMGGGLTRNGVIGKASRLKLPRREPTVSLKPKRVKPHGHRGQPKVNAIVNAVASRRIASAEAFNADDSAGVDVTRLIGIMDLTAHTCRFPIGDPLKKSFGFCGAATGGETYCENHCARCFGVR